MATFTDDDPTLTVDNFTASVQWGDGGTSSTSDGSASITADGNGGFIVRSSHQYQEEGAFPVIVTVHDIANNLDGSAARNVSQEDGNQAEGTVAVDPTNPADVFVASVDENGVNANPSGGGLFAAYSTDGGKTWNARSMADGTDGLPLANGDPKAVFDQFGNLLFLTYLSADGSSVVLARSSDGGQTFTLVQTFSPAGTVPGALGVDQPSLATGAGSSAGSGSVWLSFTDMQHQVVDVAGAPVSDKGSVGTFSDLASVPGSNGGAFGGIAVGPAGQVLVSFFNLNAATQPSTIFASLDAGGLGAAFGPAVAVTTTNVGTQDFIAPQAKRGIQAEAFLAWDNSTGPHHGRIYLAYVDSQANGNNDTDIFVRSSDDNGVHWSAPVRVDDATGAASRFLPNIAVDPLTGTVAVAWYDTRNDPAGVKAQLFAALSSDGGQTFTPNVQLSTGSSDATDPKLNEFGQNFQFGDYIGLAIGNGFLYPAWADNSTQLGLNPDLPQFDLAAASVVLAQVADLPLTGDSLILMRTKERSSPTRSPASRMPIRREP